MCHIDRLISPKMSQIAQNFNAVVHNIILLCLLESCSLLFIGCLTIGDNGVVVCGFGIFFVYLSVNLWITSKMIVFSRF